MPFDATTDLHLTIRPSSIWFSNCITVFPTIATPTVLSTLAYNDPILDFAAPGIPMFRMIVTYILSTKSAALIYRGHHSVFDAISIPLFLADLNTLLLWPTATLAPLMPYKVWADH